jgi:hypothetical protein
VHGDQRIGQVELKDAVRAIQRTVEISVDDIVIAAKVVRSAGTWFDELAPLSCDQQLPFALI